MDTMTTLNQRKAIRSYTGEAPSAAAMAQIMTALQEAPVAMGRFANLHATVVKDPALLKAIDAAGEQQFGNAGMLHGAPVFVLISAKPAGEALGNADYSSAAIAVHNMAIAATAAGVGCCHIWGVVAALNQSPATVAKLQLPAGFIPCCGLTLGQGSEPYAPRETTKRIQVTEL